MVLKLSNQRYAHFFQTPMLLYLFLMMCLSYFQYGLQSEPTQGSSRCLLSLMMHETKKSTWWRLIIGYIIWWDAPFIGCVCVMGLSRLPSLSIPPSPWQHVYKNKWWIICLVRGVQLAAYTVVIEGLVIAAPSVTDKSMYGTLFVNARSPVIYQFLKPMEHI